MVYNYSEPLENTNMNVPRIPFTPARLRVLIRRLEHELEKRVSEHIDMDGFIRRMNARAEAEAAENSNGHVEDSLVKEIREIQAEMKAHKELLQKLEDVEVVVARKSYKSDEELLEELRAWVDKLTLIAYHKYEKEGEMMIDGEQSALEDHTAGVYEGV